MRSEWIYDSDLSHMLGPLSLPVQVILSRIIKTCHKKNELGECTWANTESFRYIGKSKELKVATI